MKIKNDKYYTNPETAKYCIKKINETLEHEYISEFLEPSAGSGIFLDCLESENRKYIAYDIEPEDLKNRIIKQDYLNLCLDYKEGRCIIGNPPFGSRLNLAIKFYKKSVTLGDYICFILPISQLNNNNSMYEFDLIYSEDLGKIYFTDRYLHCCFNIYKKPSKGINKKPIRKLKDVKIIRQDSANYESQEYDLRMCYWGDGTAGKILTDDESYSGEYKIIINNEDKKQEILKVLRTYDWRGNCKNIAMKKIQQHHIIEVLKKYVKDIN